MAADPDGVVERRLHHWRRFIDVRQNLVDRIVMDDQRDAAACELAIVDAAIVDGGDRTLQGVLQRIRDVRLVRAIALVEELLKLRESGGALDDLKSKVKTDYVRSCLMTEVSREEFLRVLAHADVTLTLRKKGSREASMAVLEAVAAVSIRTIYRALESMRQEFEIHRPYCRDSPFAAGTHS